MARIEGKYYAGQMDLGNIRRSTGKHALLISRTFSMPTRHTFKIRAVAELLAEEVTSTWIDPFCGHNSPAYVKNDANEIIEDCYHFDGLEFLKMFQDETCGGVLFDPPYSLQMALRKYRPKHNGTAGRTEYHAACKNEIARIVCSGGKVISFGWSSSGMGRIRGFRVEKILLINHGGNRPDTIVTVERKTPLK